MEKSSGVRRQRRVNEPGGQRGRQRAREPGSQAGSEAGRQSDRGRGKKYRQGRQPRRKEGKRGEEATQVVIQGGGQVVKQESSRAQREGGTQHGACSRGGGRGAGAPIEARRAGSRPGSRRGRGGGWGGRSVRACVRAVPVVGVRRFRCPTAGNTRHMHACMRKDCAPASRCTCCAARTRVGQRLACALVRCLGGGGAVTVAVRLRCAASATDMAVNVVEIAGW